VKYVTSPPTISPAIVVTTVSQFDMGFSPEFRDGEIIDVEAATKCVAPGLGQ
jgi:hypothetical protein